MRSSISLASLAMAERTPGANAGLKRCGRRGSATLCCAAARGQDRTALPNAPGRNGERWNAAASPAASSMSSAPVAAHRAMSIWYPGVYGSDYRHGLPSDYRLSLGIPRKSCSGLCRHHGFAALLPTSTFCRFVVVKK